MNFPLFHLINNSAGRFDPLDDGFEFAATGLIFVVFAVAGVLAARALWRRQIRHLVEMGSALLLAFLIATGLGNLSNQLRPFQSHPVHQLIAHEGGVSMPSDHATAAFTIAFAVGLFLSRRWGIALSVAAAVIGFARVWAGLHYPGDILAAAVIAALAVLVVRVTGRWRRGAVPTGPVPDGR